MLSKSLKTLIFVSAFLFSYAFSQPVVNEHDIEFVSPTKATLVGEDGVIMTTTDLGDTWTELNSGITNVLYSHASVDLTNSFVVGENGVILETNDGGLNWELRSSGTLNNLYKIEILPSQTIVACGDNGTILSSEDGGETWNSVNSGTTEKLNDVRFYGNSIGFIVGNNSVLLKSLDQGRTWERINLSLGIDNIKSIGVIDQNKFTIIHESGFITYTNDGGNTWNDGGFFPYSLNDIEFFNSTTGIIAGDNGLILKTTNGGESWFNATALYSNMANDLFAVSFADLNNGICTGQDGLEMYTTDGGSTWYENKPEQIRPVNKPGDFITLKGNFPNPFNPSTKINYDLNFDANVSVKVYDINGKQVSELYTGYQKTGSYSLDFNASNLASGVYFYRIIAQNGNTSVNKVMRMILTK